RSGPRRIRRVLPARAAAGAGVLAGDAARADTGSRARPHRGVRTRAQVTRQTFPPAHPFLAGAKRGRTMADVLTVVAEVRATNGKGDALAAHRRAPEAAASTAERA